MHKLFDYYERYTEDTRLIKDKAHLVEFITTISLLERFVKPGANILDVGAGTGRYSLYFAERGHSVYALDFVLHNVAIIQDKLINAECKYDIKAAVGDGRDLSRFDDNSFEAVLCMGPLYHLSTIEDRRKCLSECLRVLKKDGILVVAYINKFASSIYQIKSDKNFIKDAANSNIINHGYFYGDERDNFYFTSPTEVVDLIKNFHVDIAVNAGTDGIGYIVKDIVDNLDEDEYQCWIDNHLRICEEPSILGYSLHGLIICKKL